MENPFVFGKAVVGKYFVNREDEIAELKSALLSGQNMVLFSPRKMGKTSLILEVFRRTKEAKCVYIDLWQITSAHSLAREIINRLVAATYTSIEKLGRDIKQLLKEIRPKIYLSPEGGIELEFTDEELKDGFVEAIDFAERIAQKKSTKIIMAFDEFQEIERMGGLKLEKLFRSTIQHHQNVSYIFAGSERSLVEIIFGEKQRPFYRSAKHKELRPIEREILEDFITRKFAESGKNIEKEAACWIVEFSEGKPYYVQHICHEAWYATDNSANTDLVKRIVNENVISALSSGFQVIWNRIKSNEQRRLLIALVNEKKPAIYSSEFIGKYELKSPGHVRKAFESLERLRLLEKGEVWDLFFREWIRTTFSL